MGKFYGAGATPGASTESHYDYNSEVDVAQGVLEDLSAEDFSKFRTASDSMTQAL